MGLFDFFKKKTKKLSTSNLTKQDEQPADNRAWLEKYYMPGYDVGEIKGYTDLPERPRCDEEGIHDILEWCRYRNIIIITGLTVKEIDNLTIPQTIQEYTVAGIDRMAFLHCKINTVVIPDTVQFIGGMAIGFTSVSAYSDEEERKIRAQKPFAESWPRSTLVDKSYFLHTETKTTIMGKCNTIAEKYSAVHHLQFCETLI